MHANGRTSERLVDTLACQQYMLHDMNERQVIRLHRYTTKDLVYLTGDIADITKLIFFHQPGFFAVRSPSDLD
jgi:hypothetical protein